MKEALTFLTAICILAIAQTVASALGVVLLILATLGAFASPRATCQLLASLGLLALALKEPAYCVAALGAIGVAVAIVGRAGRPSAVPKPTVLLLPDRSRG